MDSPVYWRVSLAVDLLLVAVVVWLLLGTAFGWLLLFLVAMNGSMSLYHLRRVHRRSDAAPAASE